MKPIPLWIKLLGGIGVLATACAGLAFVPTGEVAYAPNAPIDLDGKFSVGGRPAEPLQGRMYLVGVSERKVNMLQRLLLDASDPDIDFGPEPTGSGHDGPAPADVQSMADAKEVAAGVAFTLAGEQVEWNGSGATVAYIEPGSPASKVLHRGDIIVEVNGVPVDSSVDAGRQIYGLAPGSRVQLGIQRAGTATRAELVTAAGEGEHRSRIGVSLSTIGLSVDLPRPVSIDSGEVVGPSAGLAFALYIYDAISPDDLLRGRYVVISGALAPDGQVIAVGRMRQKAIAAQAANRDLIIVPSANAAEAITAVEEACGDEAGCTQVVPVRTAAEAVELLLLDPSQLGARLEQQGAGAAAAQAAVAG